MTLIITLIFFIGYLFITLEHSLKIDKLIPSIGMMAVLWAILSMCNIEVFEVNTTLKELEPSFLDTVLLHHLGKTSEILLFLIGAMTIVEVINYFNGFDVFKSYIQTRSKKKLLFIFSTLAFVLSAIIDNLTATIVLLSILQKIIKDKEIKFWYASIIIIAANAGGAWSPIGDVTTTMLWIAGKVTTLKLISNLLVPSLICCFLPVLVTLLFPVFKGKLPPISKDEILKENKTGALMLRAGILSIVFVPVFKSVTGLPPYIGMSLSLAFVCLVAEIITRRKFTIKNLTNSMTVDTPKYEVIHTSLSKIEFSSILFFFGILMSVAALESMGLLFHFSENLNAVISNTNVVIFLLGIGSAIIDNVPLVAASIGMFSEGVDSSVWHLLAYSAGTGGSLLIIGSAAGVIAMGMEKIDFFKYLKKISILAFIGFGGGYLYLIFVL